MATTDSHAARTAVGASIETQTRRGRWGGAITVLALISLAIALLLVLRPDTSGTEPPSQIRVGGRDYRSPVGTTLVEAQLGSGTWQRVGTMPGSGVPIYATVITGSAPTAVFVKTKTTTSSKYVQYTIVGGP